MSIKKQEGIRSVDADNGNGSEMNSTDDGLSYLDRGDKGMIVQRTSSKREVAASRTTIKRVDVTCQS